VDGFGADDIEFGAAGRGLEGEADKVGDKVALAHGVSAFPHGSLKFGDPVGSF
jgi:hypothetical protein